MRCVKTVAVWSVTVPRMYVGVKYVLKNVGKTAHPTKRGRVEFHNTQALTARQQSKCCCLPCQAEFSYGYPKEPPKHLRETTLSSPLILGLSGVVSGIGDGSIGPRLSILTKGMRNDQHFVPAA
jgi:hypothetical protein